MKKLITVSSIFLLLLLMPSCKTPTNTTPSPNTTSPGSTTLPAGNQSTTPVVVVDKPGVGDPAPDLQLTDMTGKTVSLADFKGQIVWLNFWASW